MIPFHRNLGRDADRLRFPLLRAPFAAQHMLNCNCALTVHTPESLGVMVTE